MYTRPYRISYPVITNTKLVLCFFVFCLRRFLLSSSLMLGHDAGFFTENRKKIGNRNSEFGKKNENRTESPFSQDSGEGEA